MMNLDTLKTHAEALVFERFKHLELDRYTIQSNRVVLFFLDGSFRSYELRPPDPLNGWLYVPLGRGRFRNAKTKKLITYIECYNNPIYVA